MKRLPWLVAACFSLVFSASAASTLNISQTPLFITDSVAPLTMLVISRDHKLYFPAYNDAGDVNGDGQINLRFAPSIDYYGYFDSYKCYRYSSDEQYFYPVSVTNNKTCPGQWSGNFLNYVTTARLDAVRKVLFGGYRAIDNTNFTVLERTYVPQDAHSWGKEYNSAGVDGFSISNYTPFGPPSASNEYHLFVNTTLRNSGTGAPLLRVALYQPYRIWQWVGIERPVAGARAIHGSNGALIDGIQDFVVRVRVCDETVGLEANCQSYPNGEYKPIGLLQEFGENEAMLFGLITGSYTNNLAGGVLRKNIGSIRDEIVTETGQFSNVNGIIATLNKLTVTGFQTNYTYRCGWITDRNIVNGECEMWGNPLAEMMYESLRYFAGRQTPTSAFNSGSGTDFNLGLPNPAWDDPYADNPRCAKANMLVISDLFPNYDGDYVPGSHFGGASDSLGGLNAAELAQTIFSGEGLGSVIAFIGQSGGIFDGAPTPKPVNSFGNIRGLAPHESNSEGTFYSAAVAYFGWTNDLNPAEGTQNVKSFMVGISSEQPEFKFNVGGNTITLVPFGKSVGSTSSGFPIDSEEGEFQPNNSIVDYFIEEISPERAVFRVNFEDVQQGADFDMDAIVRYEVTVDGNNLHVNLISEYAAGSIIQHLGYVISGSTEDGVYLEVRDNDTAPENDINYFLDTPPGEQPGGNWETGLPLPLTASRTFQPSSDPSAIFFKSPLWYAAKWGGFNDLNDNNIPDQQEEWDTDGSGQPDNYFLVNNLQNLPEQLTKAFDMILDRTGSFSSAALSSGFLSSDTLIYQSVFRTKQWSGQLLAFPIDVDTGDILTNGTGPNGSLWDAAQLLENQNYNTGRNIITYKPSNDQGIRFRWPGDINAPGIGELDLEQIAALSTSPTSGLIDELGQERLEYLRGNRSLEQANGGTFRDRLNKLGDIIDSNPVEVSVPNARYPRIWLEDENTTAPENNAPYQDFRDTHLDRQPVLYVGANDGMLHAFNAQTGREMFAYVPATVFKNLNRLTDPNYSHRYFVNGSPTVVDAFQNNAWQTVLVGTLQAGGQGVFALNVTNPADFSEANANNLVKWEFTDADDADMGSSFGKASIVRMHNGRWAAVFGNGYNNTASDGNSSTTGNAVLFIVDLETGDLIRKIDTGMGMAEDPLNAGRPNGLSSPAVVDLNGNHVADFIYAGDLFGNLWKIDVQSQNPGQWEIAFKQGNTPLPFFVAQDANGNRQPITIKPTVSRLSFSPSGLQIYIGTGKFFEEADKTDMSIQSVYGLRDDGEGRITGRSELVEQTILAESGNARAVSNNLVANNERGWYLDLIVLGNAQGERVVSDMVFINDKLIFSTIIPSEDPCEFGGDSWLMELNALTGARLNYTVFDMNQDGEFDASDNMTVQSGGETISVPVSGMKSEVGLISTPSILNAGNVEYKYLPGTSGGIQKVTENPGQQATGRQSWRQLQ